MFSKNLDISNRYQTTKYNSLYNLCKIPKVQNTIWSIFPRIPHSSYSLLWRYIHILLKNSEKIGGHVLNKKNILSVLHAPLFLPFSRRTQLVCDVLTFTLTSFSDKWLIHLAMSPKCLLDTPVCHPVQKMPHFTDKSAIFRQKVWDYFIANSFRLHHGGTSGLFSGLDPLKYNKSIVNYFARIHNE